MTWRRARLRQATAEWLAATEPSAAAFSAATADPRRAQERRLAAILATNATSDYGLELGLNSVSTIGEFRRRVPIVTYDEVAGPLCAARTVAEPVLMFETTSGSSAARKRIPYTASLRSEFMSALDPWMHDLYASRPHLQGGSAYWSVSPAVAGRGFDDDREYFEGPSRRALEDILVLPPEIARIRDLQRQRYLTLRHLAADPDLSVMSVWNPTILTLMMRDLERWFDRIVADVAADDSDRAQQLTAAGPTPTAVWPRLALISCWGDAAASLGIPAVRSLFRGVEIQPKGLIATEGVISIPFGRGPGSVAAITSHFLEFRRGEDVYLVDELSEGLEYEVILTNGGGLYRYCLGDMIRVVGHQHRTPRIEFVGRADDVADLAGEKLSEPFVRAVLAAFAADAQLLFLAPVWGDERGGYALFAESAMPDAGLEQLAGAVDAALGANVHYDYCRRSGQLAPLFPVRLLSGAADLYLQMRAASGRIGDVKPRALETELGWLDRLRAARAVA